MEEEGKPPGQAAQRTWAFGNTRPGEISVIVSEQNREVWVSRRTISKEP